jgi:putative peptidoglycan lipid II flippase
MLVKVLSPGYYARQDTKTPVRIGIRALLIGMALNVVFVLTLLETGWAPAHAGLAAATSCSALFNATMLFIGLRRAQVLRPGPGWAPLFVQVGVACIAMTAFIYWVQWAIGDWLVLTSWQQIGALTLCVGGAAAVYFGTCLMTGVRPRALRAPV